MYVFSNLKANPSAKRLLRDFIIAATALLAASVVPGVIFNQASATELSPNWFRPHFVSHKKYLKKVSFVTGTSAVYKYSKMLPKTEHFFQPVIKANFIVGNSSIVCTPSGLGHRGHCGASY